MPNGVTAAPADPPPPPPLSKKTLACNYCPEKFARSEHLRRHLLRHTGEQPYHCDVCHRRFARPDSARRHRSLHVGAPPSRQSSHASSQVLHLELTAGPPSADSAQALTEHMEPSQAVQEVENNIPNLDVVAGPSPMYDPLWQEGVNLDFYNGSGINWIPPRPITSDEMATAAGDLFVDPWSPQSHFDNRRGDWHAQEMSHNIQPAGPESGHSSPQTVLSAATSNTASERGTTYVDSSLTRAAVGKNRTLSTTIPVKPHLEKQPSSFGFSPDSCEDPRTIIHDATYAEMLDWFGKTCTVRQNLFTAFSSENFPSPPKLDRLIDGATQHVCSVMPFLDSAAVRSGRCTWLLYLSLSLLGGHLADRSEQKDTDAMMEFLTRAMQVYHVPYNDRDDVVIEYVQSKLLLCICKLFSSESDIVRQGQSLLGELIAYHKYVVHESLNDKSVDDVRAAREEARFRTSHTIWLVDCIVSYQQQQLPSVSIHSNKAPLPHYRPDFDGRGVADTAAGECPPGFEILNSALEVLYIQKCVQENLSEFSRILLIHGLFLQTKDIGRKCMGKLADFDPLPGTCAAQDNEPSETWLPAIAHFAKWRNCACDCLDVLHWRANAQIGASKGSEHPTVLFLHLARVNLLSPIDDLQYLASMLVGDKKRSKAELSRLSKVVARWALEDRYKARLAIIHAGVLFFHVRRHSADAFYEPGAVYMATLCLWAYAYSFNKSGASIQAQEESAHAEEGSHELPELIHLDRPADDELVQLFIVHGSLVKPNITGAGCIHADGGPARVLQVGIRMLQLTNKWGVHRTYVSILSRLLERTRGSGSQAEPQPP